MLLKLRLLLLLFIPVFAQFTHALQIPCFVDFDKACNIIPYSYCDAEAQECKCLPNFVEKGFACKPELGAFCDVPGQMCPGVRRTVCSAEYRCVCVPGFTNIDNQCMPNPTTTPPPMRSPEIDINQVQAPSSLFNFSPLPQQNQNELYGNTVGSLERPVTAGQAGATKPMIRNFLVQKLLQNPDLRELFIKKLMMGQVPGIDDVPQPFGVTKSGIQLPVTTKTQKPPPTAYQTPTTPAPLPTTTTPPKLVMVTPFPPMTLIVPEIRCQSTRDCAMKSPNSLCRSGLCVCERGYIENNAKCFPGLGSSCSASSPCFIRYSQCDELGVCRCQMGFRGHNGSCLPGIGSECNKPGQQCNGVRNSLCSNEFMCKCAVGYKDSNGECLTNDAMSSSSLTLRAKLGLPCSIADCSQIANTKCNEQGRCACAAGYKQADEKCRPVFLTETVCMRDSDCKLRDMNARCNRHLCACALGFHMLLGKCYPGINALCTMSLPCGIANSYCSDEGVCACKENYIANNGKCVEIKRLFQQALVFADAGNPPPSCRMGSNVCEMWSPNSVCHENGRCACAPPAKFEPESQSCVYHFPRVMFTNAAALASSIRQHPSHQKHDMSAVQRNMINYGRAPHRILQALKAHHESGDMSEPLANYKLLLQSTLCTEIGRECIGIANSLCTVSGTCICVPGYVTTETGCKSDEPNLRQLDEDDENAICEPNGTCMCKQGFIRIFAGCYPALGTVCNERIWCGVPNSECGAEGYCVCKEAYKQWKGQCEEIEPDTLNDIIPFDLPENWQTHEKVYGFENLECSNPGFPCDAVPGAQCNSSFMCQCPQGYLRTDNACKSIDDILNGYLDDQNHYANLMMEKPSSFAGLPDNSMESMYSPMVSPDGISYETGQRVPHMRPNQFHMMTNTLMNSNKPSQVSNNQHNNHNNYQQQQQISNLSHEDQAIITKLIQLQAQKNQQQSIINDKNMMNSKQNDGFYGNMQQHGDSGEEFHQDNTNHHNSHSHHNHQQLQPTGGFSFLNNPQDAHPAMMNAMPAASTHEHHNIGYQNSNFHGANHQNLAQPSNSGHHQFGKTFNDVPLPDGHNKYDHFTSHSKGGHNQPHDPSANEPMNQESWPISATGNHFLGHKATFIEDTTHNNHAHNTHNHEGFIAKPHMESHNSTVIQDNEHLYDAMLKLQTSLMQNQQVMDHNNNFQHQVTMEPVHNKETIHHEKCMPGFVEIKGHCLPGVALGYQCHDSKQCSSVQAGSYCSHGTCHCLPNHIAFNASSCLPVLSLASQCSISSQCGIGKSHCHLGTCQCLSKYVPILGLCFAGLGVECSDVHGGASMKCGVRNSVCLSGVCRCRDGSINFPCT